jgi:hypothetical protein
MVTMVLKEFSEGDEKRKFAQALFDTIAHGGAYTASGSRKKMSALFQWLSSGNIIPEGADLIHNLSKDGKKDVVLVQPKQAQE